MNPEIKKEWVEELRSGKWKQGTGYLHSDNQFCCLGVLCEIAVRHKVIPPPISTSVYGEGGIYKYGSSDDDDIYGTEFLPPEVAAWAGIDHNPDYLAYEGSDGEITDVPITELNDEYCTFNALASLIEEQW